ncbi:MAG: hypothetical protein Q9186_007244 [Xanthomendoza sp. 1 TL-2023]
MTALLYRVLVAGSIFSEIISLPIRSQAVFGVPGRSNVRKLQDFGVGFDLTASYGTAAVSYANGTVMSVAKITADDRYNENIGDSWKDRPREALRSARKAMGLPASKDVGYLANVLFDLRAQVEKDLGAPIESAGVTTPHLIALYQEDLQDTFDYVGLRYLSFPVRYDVLYETSAAYAGYGYGLCSDYTDQAVCKQQQLDMDSEVVMAILYTRSALTVSFSVAKSAYYLYEPDNRYLSNFTLGSDARGRWASVGEYWKQVASNLEYLMAQNPYYERPTKVLLMGDQVHDETFTQTLEAVLRRQTADMPDIVSEDSQFVAAKGAAVMAKRIPYDPYK